VDLHKYHPGGEHTTPIYASRGCPFDCAFCSKITGRVFRVLPLPQVVEEIKEVMNLGFNHILFGDDNFAIQNDDRIKKLLSALKSFNIDFRLNQDVRTVKEDIFALADKAGCTEISFRIESGSPRMLRLMNKKASVEDNKRARQLTKRYGMKAKAYFVVNFPGETEETIKETLRFVEETRPNKWLVSAFVPLPGSQTFHYPERYGIKQMSSNWEDYYLVGKDGSFKPAFYTDYLTFKKQIKLHDMLCKGIKDIIG